MTSDLAQLDQLRLHLRTAGNEAPSGVCPTDEELWSAVTGALPKARLAELVDHSLACSRCRESWALARELAAEADETGARLTIVGARSRRYWLPAAGAAAAMVAAIAVLLGIREPQRPASGYRSEARLEIRPLTADDRPLPRASCILRWTGPAGARYDLLVAGDDLKVVVKSRGLETSEYRIPADKVASLPPGARLVWRVEAELPDGRRVASPSFIAKLE